MLRRLARDRARLRQVGWWVALGIAALGAEGALLWLLDTILSLPLWLASALAAETLIVVRFVVADHWVFGHARPTAARLWRYHGACAGAFCISWAVLNGSAVMFGAPLALAFLLGTGASFVWSLAASFLWVWAPGPRVRPAGSFTVQPVSDR